MNAEYLRIALRSLRNRRLRSWLTMIGIFIGISAVVSLIGLGEGLRTAISNQFGVLGTDVLSVQASGSNLGPPGSGVPNPLKSDLVQKIERLQGVKIAFGRIIRTAKMEFNNQQQIIFVSDIPSGSKLKPFEEINNLKAAQGRLLKEGDSTKVLLGYDYSKPDLFGKSIAPGDNVIINGKKFQVVGILESKGSFIYDQGIYMNKDSMLNLFGDKGTVDAITIEVINPKQIAQVKDSVERLLRHERHVKAGQEDFTVQTPQSALATLNSTLFAIQLFVYIIAGISLLVGGIGIMNTMFTSVLERRKEIGIMKAIGARNSDILSIFLFESGFLGLIGGLIGVAIGYALATGLAAVGRTLLGSDLIEASISLYLMIGSLAFSFVLGMIFGIIPARRASGLNPVDALRK